jgi:hypothetical protein
MMSFNTKQSEMASRLYFFSYRLKENLFSQFYSLFSTPPLLHERACPDLSGGIRGEVKKTEAFAPVLKYSHVIKPFWIKIRSVSIYMTKSAPTGLIIALNELLKKFMICCLCKPSF